MTEREKLALLEDMMELDEGDLKGINGLFTHLSASFCKERLTKCYNSREARGEGAKRNGIPAQAVEQSAFIRTVYIS